MRQPSWMLVLGFGLHEAQSELTISNQHLRAYKIHCRTHIIAFSNEHLKQPRFTANFTQVQYVVLYVLKNRTSKQSGRTHRRECTRSTNWMPSLMKKTCAPTSSPQNSHQPFIQCMHSLING